MRAAARACRRLAWRDEEGLTTVGVVISLLLVLSLVFSSAQVYRVQSISSKTQSVADAAALAAGNVIAEFMVAVRVCDAVALSMTMTSLTSTGLGIVACCVPGAQAAGGKLIEAGARIGKARDSFSQTASKGLSRVQKALPFLSAAAAAGVAGANGTGSSRYAALALLAPDSAEDISVEGESGEAREAREDAAAQADEIKRCAEEAERAALQAQEAKRRAFEHDCGARPGYCMSERADALAHLPSSANPVYSSVDAWSFSVALRRAQAYYPARLALEKPDGASVEQQARSALRKRFYAWAAQEVGRGYVHEGDGFEASFPHLPRNTEQMRSTSLYTEAVYPLTQEGASPMLHAWEGCPEASGAAGRASIEDMDEGSWQTCPACGFTAASMGKIAAASTSIDNGFEHHYEEVAKAAEEYQEAQERARPAKQEVKKRAQGLFDRLREACSAVGAYRIDARPPGSKGVVCLVASVGEDAPSKGFESTFVQATGQLGCRVAVSASTLVADPSGEGRSVIASLTDGIAGNGALAGVLGAASQLWSGMLEAYADGQSALDAAVREGLGSLPLIGAAGLGDWAADALSAALGTVGLQPAKLDALRPAVVNSAHVAAAGEGAFFARLLQMKRTAIAHPLMSNDVVSSLVGTVRRGALEEIDASAGSIEIASIGVGGASVPIEIALPPTAKDLAKGAVDAIADELLSVYASATGRRPWD